jgi:hypothetical protein
MHKADSKQVWHTLKTKLPPEKHMHNERNKVNNLEHRTLSSESSSNSNKENINDNNNNSSIDLLIEGMALAQSSVVSLIDTYSEFLKDAPKMIEYWYNIFSEPWTRTTTTIENKEIK